MKDIEDKLGMKVNEDFMTEYIRIELDKVQIHQGENLTNLFKEYDLKIEELTSQV
eukprot:CAMPEP_0170567960 /NCGR_PEP_ID=MMETSP0211-20121228/80822_1 /TAXON_ID=311385 /ORGANISM="Pseudokeronopsis sp., Strain OXSARD2" /LENGTH=54 /DNA_ID=CAMNT_0010889583 /DNA_START=867 /DNA_END=1031 /DNA_ORIENTATION=+